jgi:hypothetical protein
MNKRDLSISMTRANVLVILLVIPAGDRSIWAVPAVQSAGRPHADIEFSGAYASFALSVVVHELIHGVTWVLATRRTWSAVKFGFQWKTLTPYAHIKEPTEVNAYRIGAFMPGNYSGHPALYPFLDHGEFNLLWFSLLNTTAAGGDWLILWMIRNVKAGTLVEDHPTNAGCYVLEGQ